MSQRVHRRTLGTRIPYTTAPGTEWKWPRCEEVGGKANFWGRSSARFGDIDFRAASLDGCSAWTGPSPTRRSRRTTAASSADRRREHGPEPSEQSGRRIPAADQVPLPRLHPEAGRDRVGVPYLPDRIAQLTALTTGIRRAITAPAAATGCETGSFFSPTCSPARRRADGQAGTAHRTRSSEDVSSTRTAVPPASRTLTRDAAEVEVARARSSWPRRACESAHIMLNSKSPRWPDGIANSSGQLGRTCAIIFTARRPTASCRNCVGQPSLPRQHRRHQSAGCLAGRISKSRVEEEFVARLLRLPWRRLRLSSLVRQCSFEGFGSDFKRDIRRYYPAPVSFTIQAPSLPAPTTTWTSIPR